MLGSILLALVVDCAVTPSGEERERALASYRAGRDLAMAQEWVAAEDPLVAATRLDPLLPEAHYALGQSYLARKRYSDAVAAFARSRDAFLCAAASDATRREVEGRLEAEIRVYRDSIRTLESERLRKTAVGWREMNQDTSSALGSTVRALQQLEARVAELQRLRKRGIGPPPELFLAAGSAYFGAGAMPEAEREYRAALAIDPRLGEGHNNLAVVLMLTGRLEEAESEVKLARKAGLPPNPRLDDEIRKRKEALRP